MWNSWDHSRFASPFPPDPLRPSVILAGEVEAEIVTLEAMRSALKVNPTDTSNDDYLTSLIVSARIHAERYTHRSLSKKPYLMSLSRFPNRYWDKSDKINLWYPPLTKNVSVKYIDINGVEQTLISGQDFQVDFAGDPGRVAPLAQNFWPQTKYGVMNAVRIFYTAGYEARSSLRNSADAESTGVQEPEIESTAVQETSQVSSWTVDRTIPNDLVFAIKALIMHWYQNRIPIVTIAGAGGVHQILPLHVEAIFDAWTFDTMTPTVTPEY